MPSTYYYDDLGRLTGVAEMPGSAAFYRYDGVGNLVGIDRTPSSVVAIIDFTPKSGPVGTSITIWGTGFSDAAAANRVEFSGTAAVVVSASATRLVATVPIHAATGPITVTTPAGSASGSITFNVTIVPGVPTISGFSPNIGPAGTPVAITGANLRSTDADCLLSFNRTLARLTSASETMVEAEVPLGVASGRISVSTPFGQATSEEDFFVPPTPHTVADVNFTGRLALAESVTMTSAGPGIALIVFDGDAGRQVNLGITKVGLAGGGLGLIEISILDPYSTTLVRNVITDLGGDIDTDVLRDSGNYTIVVDPLEATLEHVSLTLSEPLVRALPVDGPPVTIALRPGQNAQLTFEGTGDQHLSLGISDPRFGPEGPSPQGGKISIDQPNGANLASRLLTRDAMSIHLGPLPETGIYTIEVDPREAQLENLTLTLSPSLTGSLPIDGPTRTIGLRQGQDARLTFEITADTRVNLGITEARFNIQHDVAGGVVSIIHPDGTTLASASIRETGSKIATQVLPDAGTYTIIVDPKEAALESLALTLTEPLAGTLDIDGPEANFALRSGQDARLLFEGQVGQRVRLDIRNVSFDVGGAISGGTVSVVHPDGTLLASSSLSTGNSEMDIGLLPDTASYAIVIQPPGALSVSLTLHLSQDLS
jgi:YD repeat-containing protein